MTTRRLALTCAWIGALFFAVTGAWAFLIALVLVAGAVRIWGRPRASAGI